MAEKTGPMASPASAWSKGPTQLMLERLGKSLFRRFGLEVSRYRNPKSSSSFAFPLTGFFPSQPLAQLPDIPTSTGALGGATSPPGFRFTRNWTSGHFPIWDEIISKVSVRKILEIGSFEGFSTCYFILKCARDSNIEVFCIDSWEGGIEHKDGAAHEADMSQVERLFDQNVALAKALVMNQVSVVKCKSYSNVALPKILVEGNRDFDLVYIDGSHQAPDVLTDAVMSFQVLRPGGILIFDDYLWSMEKEGAQDSLNMPKPAIDAFVNIFQRRLRVIGGAPLGQLFLLKL